MVWFGWAGTCQADGADTPPHTTHEPGVAPPPSHSPATRRLHTTVTVLSCLPRPPLSTPSLRLRPNITDQPNNINQPANQPPNQPTNQTHPVFPRGPHAIPQSHPCTGPQGTRPLQHTPSARTDRHSHRLAHQKVSGMVGMVARDGRASHDPLPDR